MEIIVRNQQNIYDIAIQYFGDISFVPTIIVDNNLVWAAPLETGQVLTLNNEGVGNDDIKNFFTLTGAIVQNGAVAVLGTDPLTFDSVNITWDRTDITFDNNPNIP